MKGAARLQSLGRLVLCVFLAALLCAMAIQDVTRHLVTRRGVATGLEADLAPLVSPRLGTNVSLEQYEAESQLVAALDDVRSLGMGTVRQHFPWAEIEPEPGAYAWERWDAIVAATSAQGFRVIAVLDTSPMWARDAWETANPYAPPRDLADYARFAGAFSARYAPLVDAYQIWDEPNIYPRWGQGAISPAGYVDMLRLASRAIRQEDPEALIVAGGLAPNLEAGGRNMSDVQFLREIYRRGAGKYFDVLGVKAYGFWSGPYDRRVEEATLNLSRVILLREEMVRRSDGAKPLWALEAGWCALPADWTGEPSPQGSDAAALQSQRLLLALERVQREWPWMGLVLVGHLQPAAPPTSPVWGYALREPSGAATAAHQLLLGLMKAATVLPPGRTTRLTRLIAPVSASTATWQFWGNEIVLRFTGPLASEAPIISDLMLARSVLPRRSMSSVYRLRTNDLPAMHHLTIPVSEAVRLNDVVVGAHRSRAGLVLGLVVALGACAWLILVSWRAARDLPWRRAWGRCQARWGTLSLGLRWAALLIPAGLACAAQRWSLRVAGLGVYALAALLQPDAALLVAVASIPFAPLVIRLGSASFSVTELAILVAVGARIWEALLGQRQPDGVRAPRRRLSWLDGCVLGLVLLTIASAAMAEYRHVALRELRVVIVEPALLYGLVVGRLRRGEPGMQLADALLLSGVAVALYALLRYPSAAGVIEAEGVRRARAFYGSPNNLALYLERTLPLAGAMVLWGGTRWRRRVYGLGSLPVAAALALTFSRGAWLLGVPAALITIAWLRFGSRRRALVACVVVASVAMAGAIALGRGRLLDLTQGTGFLRVSLWQAAWDMVRDHPLLGVGPDNFLYYYGDYMRPGAEVDRWLSHPHNVLLDFWLRLGFGGVILLGALVTGAVERVRTWRRAASESDQGAIVWGLTAGLAAALGHGLIDSSFFVVELACWVMFSLAWLGSTPDA